MLFYPNGFGEGNTGGITEKEPDLVIGSPVVFYGQVKWALHFFFILLVIRALRPTPTIACPYGLHIMNVQQRRGET